MEIWKNTLRTIKPVRPVNTQISLQFSFHCSHELLWPLGFPYENSRWNPAGFQAEVSRILKKNLA